MSEIVRILNDEIRMNSQMDELRFGKTNYNTIVTQKGVLAITKNSPDKNYNFQFNEWTFSDIKAYNLPEKEKPYVFYCAPNNFSENATTFLDIMNNAEKDNASKTEKDLFFDAGFIMCSLITQIAKEEKSLPMNGAGGIIMDITDDQISVLFLPEDLYKFSSGSLSPADYSLEKGFWENSTLENLPALCFYRSVIAYKILSGKFPYNNIDITERNADILDNKFLPIEYNFKNLNPELSKEINRALKLNSNIVNIPGKKQKGKSSEDLTPNPLFPLELLYKEKDSRFLSDEDSKALEEKALAYMKAKEGQVKTKRIIRRNTSGIVAGIIAGVAIALITWNTVNANLNEYCSKGLTATQTIETFFYGVNEKDSVLLSNISSGKKVNKYISTISHIYVIGKSRRTYNNDQGFMSPEGYLFYVTDSIKNETAGLYGVTNVTINGQLSDLHPPVVLRKDKVEPVTLEKGNVIKNKDTVKYEVNYYLLHSEDIENNIEVEKIYDTFTLTYKKDRWIITNIDTSSFSVDVNSNLFKTEYFTTLSLNDKNVIQSVEALSDKYQWLPKKDVMQLYEEKLKEESLSLVPALNMY